MEVGMVNQTFIFESQPIDTCTTKFNQISMIQTLDCKKSGLQVLLYPVDVVLDPGVDSGSASAADLGS
jgi:hypothetical protein